MSVKIQAIRSFWFDGKVIEPGQIIDAPVIEASELIHGNKAQPAPLKEPEPTNNPKAKAKAEADE